MNRHAIRILVMLAVFAALLWAGSGLAYNTYTGTECATCHNGFVGRGALHDVHTAFTSNCRMCHPGSPGSKPVSTWNPNDATAYSCLGCHGRDYGAYGKQSAGLRAHHAAHGVTVCGGCHSTDPTPLGENIAPPHYSRSDVNIAGTCSDNLDNDGDDVYDGLDTDCSVPVEETTWGKIKALYK